MGMFGPTSGGSGTGTASNSFQIMQPISGTSPTAASSTDTLTFSSSDGSIAIAGNSATKTLSFTAALPGLPTAVTKGTIAIYSGSAWVVQTPFDDDYALIFSAASTNGVLNKNNRIRVGAAGNTFLYDSGSQQELVLGNAVHLSSNGSGGFQFGSTDFGSQILLVDSAGTITMTGSTGNLVYAGQRSSTLGVQSVTTTDATVTTLYTRNASPWAHDSFTYNVDLISFDSTNDIYGFWCYKVRVQTAASTSTIITTDTIGTNTVPVGYGGVTFSITSSTTFNILVQGAAAKTVTWRAYINQMASNGGQ